MEIQTEEQEDPQDQTVRPKPIKRSLNTQNPPKTETNIRGELASSCPKWADTYIHIMTKIS